jgi:ABC-2 type transport system permease protein
MLTLSLSAVVAMAIFVNSGREDLLAYALVAAVLMGIGQMAFFVGSEILANERGNQILESLLVTPTEYFLPLLTRIVTQTSLGLVSLAIAWLLARLLFGVAIAIYHPVIMLATLVMTILAASVTALSLCVLFCFGRTTRTFQNALPGPLYLLGGVLVPVTYLPAVIQPVCRLVFLYWSAELLRDTLQSEPVENVALRLAAIAVLGVAGGLLGAALLRRLLDHLRREGTLGL